MSLIISHHTSEVWKCIGVENKKKRKEGSHDAMEGWTVISEKKKDAWLQFFAHSSHLTKLQWVFGAIWAHTPSDRRAFFPLATLANHNARRHSGWKKDVLYCVFVSCIHIQCSGQKLQGSFQIIDTWSREIRLTDFGITQWETVLIASE